MPQNNVEALLGIASFCAAVLVAKLVIKIQKGDLPGGDLWVLYLRILLGFLLAGAVVSVYRSFLS